MRISFSINLHLGIPLERIDDEHPFLSFRKKAIDKFYAANANSLSKPLKPGETRPTLENQMTSMEPHELHIHLDAGFEDRNYVTLENQHRKRSAQPHLGEKYTLTGVPKGGVVEPDSKIIISASNKTLN